MNQDNKKNNVIFFSIMACFLMMIIGIFLGVYVFHDILGNNSSNNNSVKKDGTVNQEEKEYKNSVDSEIVNQAYSNYTNIKLLDQRQYKSGVSIKDFDKSDYIRIAALNAKAINRCSNGNSSNTVDDLNSVIQGIIPNAPKLSIDDYKSFVSANSNVVSGNGEPGHCFKLSDNDTSGGNCMGIKDNLIYIDGQCGDIAFHEDFKLEKIIGSKFIKDNLVIYKKVAFGRYDDSSSEMVSLYKEQERTGNSIEKIDNYNETIRENPKLDWEKYQTYKLTFNKINGKYYFNSIKPEK